MPASVLVGACVDEGKGKVTDLISGDLMLFAVMQVANAKYR